MSTPEEEHALVDRLADNMRMKLATNRERPHWKESNFDFLLSRLGMEVGALAIAIRDGEDAWAEAADVANFAAMIADNQNNADVESEPDFESKLGLRLVTELGYQLHHDNEDQQEVTIEDVQAAKVALFDRIVDRHMDFINTSLD